MKLVSCQLCPLRALPLFIPHANAEVALIESLKREQLAVAADRSIIHEGQTNAPLYTLLNGWAFRFKTLSDGRRQILNFLLPGDFIGVQQKMGDSSAHGVQALSDVVLCVFQRDAVWELHRSAPTLGFAVTWLTAHEESLVDDTLLSVGRRSAEERIATLLVVPFQTRRCTAAGGRRSSRGRSVSADATAHRRRLRAVAGAYQQDSSKTRAARSAPHRRRAPEADRRARDDSNR